MIRRAVGPLPVAQPWQETPDPIDGLMAERGEAGPIGNVSL